MCDYAIKKGFQAEYEGSIPFTRSTKLDVFPSKRFHSDKKAWTDFRLLSERCGASSAFITCRAARLVSFRSTYYHSVRTCCRRLASVSPHRRFGEFAAETFRLN